ncbi:MAG: glycosyltransferase [Saprospiraceae bacterium]|nr:glycosyltransferase [Saprospiraceae bacterium]
MVYISFTLLVGASYLFLQVIFTHKWRDLKAASAKETKASVAPTVSVIIAARNEELHIENCLKSIFAQSYPAHSMEVLLIDNHSTDQTVQLAKSIANDRVTVFPLAGLLEEHKTFKKEALEFGIAQSKAEWIATLDADCVAPSNWIETLLANAETQGLDMVLGPIKIIPGNGFLGKYQQIEIAGLQIVTAAGLSNGLLLSANGANLAFRREVFHAVNGYAGHKKKASGDDVFLLHTFHRRNPSRIGYITLEPVWVHTKPVSSIKSLLNQRIRWASKTPLYGHPSTKIISGLVFVNSVLLIMHLLLLPWFGVSQIYLFGIHFILKSQGDLYLLHNGARSFHIKITTRHWLYALILNPLLVTYVGVVSLIRPTYYWKGRQVR